jgi:hypothetical protein
MHCFQNMTDSEVFCNECFKTHSQGAGCEKANPPRLCQKCPSMHKNEFELYLHNRLIHRVKLVGCSKCGEQGFSSKTLQEHILNVHKKLKCKTCVYGAGSEEEMAKHIRNKHSKKTLACPLCTFSTNYKG